MPWAFRNRRAEDLVSLCYKFSAKLLVISRTTQSISGTSLIWRHNNKSSWRNNASLGWGMTTFVYVWLSSVICGTVVPRRWTHSATTPPYSNLFIDIDQNRNFRKFWPKSRYWHFFYTNQHFAKNLTIINNSCIFVQNQQFGKFWQKSRISETSNQNRDFSKILTKFEIFVNFDQNRDFLKIFDRNQSLLDHFDKNQHFLIFDQKLTIF